MASIARCLRACCSSWPVGTYGRAKCPIIVASQAEVAQIDIKPLGLRHGMKAADLYLRADAKLTVSAMLAKLQSGGA